MNCKQALLDTLDEYSDMVANGAGEVYQFLSKFWVQFVVATTELALFMWGMLSLIRSIEPDGQNHPEYLLYGAVLITLFTFFMFFTIAFVSRCQTEKYDSRWYPPGHDDHND